MIWGMPTYEVPLATYPDTYNGKPLMYAAFASQKRYMTVHLMGLDAASDPGRSFREAYEERVGKSAGHGRRLRSVPPSGGAPARPARHPDRIHRRGRVRASVRARLGPTPR